MLGSIGVDAPKKVSLAAAVLAALAASSCCVLPLALVGLGVGGAGAIGAATTYRPYLLAATATLLLAAHVFAYRRRAVVGDACGCAARPRRTQSVALWVATGVVVLVAAAPSVLTALPRATGHYVPPTATTAVVRAGGIDCEACSVPIRAALDRAGGVYDVQVDVPRKRVVIAFEPGAGRPEVYVAALGELGYESGRISVAEREVGK